MTPTEIAEGLIQALASRDLNAAKALTTEEGWVRAGGSVRAMAEASMKKPPPPMKVFGAVESGVFAVVGLAIQAQGRVVGKLWVLCERIGEGWLAAGMAQAAGHAGLFLKGEIPAVWEWREEPPNAAANAWIESMIEDMVQERPPRQPRPKGFLRPIGSLVAKGITAGRVTGGHELVGLGRAAVMFELTAGGSDHAIVAVLDVSGDAPRPITLAKGPSAAAFFAGITWERDLPGEPEVARPGPPRRR